MNSRNILIYDEWIVEFILKNEDRIELKGVEIPYNMALKAKKENELHNIQWDENIKTDIDDWINYRLNNADWIKFYDDDDFNFMGGVDEVDMKHKMFLWECYLYLWRRY